MVVSNIQPHIIVSGRVHIYEDESMLKEMLKDIASKELKVIDYSNQKYDRKIFIKCMKNSIGK